ncbi:MAG: aspartate carbamoyltransferase, partial [Pseudomonadota bacterium]
MLPFKSLISSSQLTPVVVEEIFTKTDEMLSAINSKGRIRSIENSIVALLFFEPSSRTMLSFQTAAQRLHAGTIFAQNASSTSFEKGESLEDMIQIVAGYADMIVMRHAEPGSAQIAADTSSVPFINAGDGGNEHPTQALIDTYTIKKHLGRLDNLRVAFGFDSLQSRSIHSLTKLLAQFPNNEFTFMGPPELAPSDAMRDAIERAGASCKVIEGLDSELDYDIVYVNRLQEERFPDKAVFEENRSRYRLTREIVSATKALILDPLPRIDEIDPAA